MSFISLESLPRKLSNNISEDCFEQQVKKGGTGSKFDSDFSKKKKTTGSTTLEIGTVSYYFLVCTRLLTKTHHEMIKNQRTQTNYTQKK